MSPISTTTIVPLMAMSSRCCSVRLWLKVRVRAIVVSGSSAFHAFRERLEFGIELERSRASGREVQLKRNLAALDDEIDDAAGVEKPAVLPDEQHVLALDLRRDRAAQRAGRGNDHLAGLVECRRGIELLRLQLTPVDVLSCRELVEHVG